LSEEPSRVAPQGLRDLIEGGAIRDTTLFHSFREFNVNDAQQVYFANPDGIANILTRVTGNNISRILGTLGVLGSANLFLINPNGIIFGSTTNRPLAGRVLLTNQYRPNPDLSGNIQIDGTVTGAILTRGVAEGGSVNIDSKGSITIAGLINASAIRVNGTFFGNGGDVRLISKGNIILNPGAAIFSGGLLGGNITLKSDADISLISPDPSPIITSVSFADVPDVNGGNINVLARSLFLSDGGLAQDKITSSATGNGGKAGDIKISSNSLDLRQRSGIQATTQSGNGGNITLETRDLVLLRNNSSISCRQLK
jgi:filamentous hemagglutinin family protein